MTNTDLCFIHLHSAMSPNTSILFIVTLWASMQAGLGLPVVKQLEVETTDSVPPLRERTKRCACSTPLDSECHYFCHLDIIWVNTPSKMTVYGLGSAMPRRRRSSGRCTCANPEDQTCTSFCHSPEKPSQKPSAKRRLSTLNILRVAVSRPERVLDAADSDQTQRKNAR